MKNLVAAALASALVSACGPAPTARSAVAGLPRYTPVEAALLDDSLAREVTGLPPGGALRDDRLLERRLEEAEGVALVRIVTVTRGVLAGAPGFDVVVEPLGAPLAGEIPDRIELRVPASSPAFPLLEQAEASIVGRRFVLLFRHYDDGGARRVHFRGETESEALRAALGARRAASGGDGEAGRGRGRGPDP